MDKERFIERVRTLPQLKKKRIQNLEYEFKDLKVRALKTGEEGKIKQVKVPLLQLFGCNHRSTIQHGSFKDVNRKLHV